MTLVDPLVMDRAQDRAIGQGRLATVDPVPHMMRLEVPIMRAPGELATALRPDEQGAAQRAAEDARLVAKLEGAALLIVERGDDAGVAEEPARRLRGNAGAVVIAGEGGGVDVEDDLDRRPPRLVAPKRGL